MATTSEAEIIGQRVLEQQENAKQRNAEMYPTWHAEGQHLKKIRNAVEVTQKQLSSLMHVSEGVIFRLENGYYVKRREAILASYKLAIEIIISRRASLVQELLNLETV